jgi:glutathione-specific gamma-glutamylcyclotransferase
MWIFGYGSLTWRPSFEFVERRRGFVRGWSRRFWQGSPDHRGVPEAPGRVVTLVEDATGICGGCAYRIDPVASDAILAALDHREKAGFVRRSLEVFATAEPDGEAPFAEALTYVADLGNPWFLGPLPERDIATWVRSRTGPSGPNVEYVLRLRDTLAALEVRDSHVEEIASLL